MRSKDEGSKVMHATKNLKPDFFGMRALVIEDQEALRDAVAFELETLGFNVSVSVDGKAGYELALTDHFDVILSDIRMPRWDGIAFLSALRKASPTAPPVIFMTGFADLTTRDAFALGADAFVGKPLNTDHLAATLSILCKPLDERWQTAGDPTPADHLIVSTVSQVPIGSAACPIAIGRGGMFVAESLGLRDARVGQRVAFSIKFEAGEVRNLDGVGRVVWTQGADGGSDESPRGTGIEFESLSGRTFLPVLEYIAKVKPKAVIPPCTVNALGIT